MAIDEYLTKAVAVGTVVTAGLFILPEMYQYAPIFGGVVVGILGGELRKGGKAGMTLGLVIFPVSIVLVVMTLYLPASIETGIDVLFRSMRGMGPMNAVFYITVVYFLVVYTAIAGGLFGTLGGGLSEVIRKRR